MKFTLLAVILMIGLAAGMWLVERFFASPEETGRATMPDAVVWTGAETSRVGPAMGPA